MDTIAILIPSLKKGGAEKQASLLARVLSSRYTVYIILTDVSQGFEPANVSLSGLDDGHIIRLEGGVISQYRRLKTTQRRIGARAMFCYLTRPDLLGPLAARKAGVEYCWQGIRNAQLPGWKVLLERLGSRYATGAVVNNYAGADAFSRKGIRNLTVIPNCYPEPRPVCRREARDTVTVVTVARFVAQKDYPTAIGAVAAAMRQNPGLRYRIIGHGEQEEQVRSIVAGYGIDDRTEILVNPPHVLERVAECDIYLSASLFEGTSNSIMEAMDVSLPVVATDVGDNARLVTDGVSGYITATGDAGAMSAAIARLASDAALRCDMGAAGNAALAREYSVEAFAGRYFELLAAHGM